MGLEVKKLSPTATSHVVTAEQRLWLTEDDRLVPEGHEDAASLFCIPGQTLSLDDAKRYGLLKKKSTSRKQAAAKAEK